MRTRRYAGLAAVLGACMLMAACGSSSGGGGSSTGAAAVQTISLGIPGANAVSAPIIVAEENGYFKKFGVNVNLVNAGSVAITEVAAGKLDLVCFGATAAFSPAKAGRQPSIVMNYEGGQAGVQVSAKSGIKRGATIGASLMELAGKRIGVQVVGTSTYGWASAINSYITAHGGKKMTLVSYTDVGTIAEALAAGELDAAVGASDSYVENFKDGTISLLIPATNPTLQHVLGQSVAAALWGLKSVLQRKRKAVVDVISAIRLASSYIASHSNEAVAEVMHRNSLYGSYTVPEIAAEVSYNRPFYNPDNGAISSALWSASLNSWKSWGLGVDLTSSALSYDAIVDMSYLDASKAPPKAG